MSADNSDIDEGLDIINDFEDPDSMDNLPPPFLSTVPLSSTGISPAQVEAKKEQLNEAEKQYVEGLIQLERVKPSSATQRAKEAYNTAAKVTGDRNAAIAKLTLKQKLKGSEKLRKEVENSYLYEDDPVHAENVRKMNEYLNLYKKRLVKFNWKKNYTYSMSKDDVAQWVKEVETMISTVNLPNMLRDMIIGSAPLITLIANLSGVGDYFRHFERDLAVNATPRIETDDRGNQMLVPGIFDDEIEQLSVTWGSFFAVSPEKRLIGKYLHVATHTAFRNAAAMESGNIDNNTADL